MNPTSVLHRRYVLGLALVAALVLANQLLVQPSLLRLWLDAPLINVAGRQRMLSQRLAKAALALEAAADDAERSRRRDELVGVLRLWWSSHESLSRREKAPTSREAAGAEERAAFEELEPFASHLRVDAEGLVAGGDPAGRRDRLAGVLRAEAEFLPRMERIVGLYEREAKDHVDRLIGVGWALTAVVLLALAGIGRFILRPATRTIGLQVEELRAARDALEARVRERTRDLEQANRELALEAERRSDAEARQRSMLEQFSHAARANTAGEMAGALAHELNQPLGAIANYAEGCLVALDQPDPPLAEVRAVLDRVLRTTLRAGAIVQRIRRFVTRHEPTFERFDPNRLVTDVEEFFRDDAVRLGTALRLDLAPGLPLLHGDPVQVQQVLVNLVRNALDAVAASQPVDPSVVMRTRMAGSGGVEFAVTDNGEGIPGDRIPRIFDAYFSTRDDGMGMGLAISRRILEAHQGKIGVESRPGEGTTFRFTLPRAVADDEGADGLRG